VIFPDLVTGLNGETMKRALCIGFLTLMFFGMGCSTVTIQSTVRPGYTQKINQVCVVVSNAQKDGDFFPLLKIQLESKFNERNVRNAVLVLNHRSGDGQALLQVPMFKIPTEQKPDKLPTIDTASIPGQIGFSPSYLLKIEIVGTGRQAGKASATLHLSLSEFDGGLQVWKAELGLEWGAGSFGAGPGAMYSPASSIKIDPARCADQILQKLEADGLLNGPGTAKDR
jgi:hypothetical protein